MKTRFVGASALVAFAAVAGSASAAITVFTDQAAFNAAIIAASTDTFNDLPLGAFTSPINRTVGSYGYTGTAASNFFPSGTASDLWLSPDTATDAIVLNNFTGGVFAVGGFFFGSNILGEFQSGTINVTATDAGGSITQGINGTPTSSFLGFISTTGIVQISVSAVQPSPGSLWPAVNDLTLATIPTPGAVALLGLGGLVAARRRRA